jgi:hypothetical protein
MFRFRQRCNNSSGHRGKLRRDGNNSTASYNVFTHNMSNGKDVRTGGKSDKKRFRDATCLKCSGDHILRECPTRNELSDEQRQRLHEDFKTSRPKFKRLRNDWADSVPGDGSQSRRRCRRWSRWTLDHGFRRQAGTYRDRRHRLRFFRQSRNYSPGHWSWMEKE